MKKLVIIGAGGMGRTLYDIAKESIGYNDSFIIKGFIDDDETQLNNYPDFPPIIGKITDYQPEQDDVFISSVGGAARKSCHQIILNKNGKFINIIHKTARIGTAVSLGQGNMIGAFVSIGANAKIGSYNMIQSYTVVGHDTEIGNFVRIDTHVVCVGGTVVKNEATIHTNSVINHKVTIDEQAKVGACSFVIKNVKKGVTVFGVPAKVI